MKNIAGFLRKVGGGVLISLFAVLLLSAKPNARAQQNSSGNPDFLITWRAQSYAPPSYRGKALPTTGTPVVVSFELVGQGKIVDLSKQPVYWYLDNEYLNGGNGVQTAAFNVVFPMIGSQEIRIEIPDFNGVDLSKRIVIPVANPEAVIEAPFPNARFSGTALQLVGQPYFFNIQHLSDLTFTWSVNGDHPQNSDSPNVLNARLSTNAPSDFALNINLTIQNPNDESETAAQSITLNH